MIMTNNWIDICCGGGGATQGIIKAGGQVSVAIEYDPKIAEVYRANFGDHIVNTDLKDFDYSQYKGLNIWASFPCQSFSMARSKFLPDRSDKDLSSHAPLIFDQVQPPYIGMENVRGWLKSEYFKEILKWLENNNYHYWYGVINFADYGVPQNRIRAILLASKYHPFPIPHKFPNRITWYDAIADLIPTLNPCKLADCQKRTFRRQFLEERIRITTSKKRSCWFVNNASESTFRQSNLQCQTLTANNPCYKVAYLQNLDNVESILDTAEVYRCSPQVGLRLQTFNNKYNLPLRHDQKVNQRLSWKVIGNSVPPQGISPFLRSLVQLSQVKQGKQLCLF